MNAGLAIFVKTPGLSPVKTRLAANIGIARAETLHTQMADTVREVVCQPTSNESLTCYWAVAEPDAASTWTDLSVLPQGGGGLGERLDRIYRRLLEKHDAALLIGADTPQLTQAYVAQAADWLNADQPRCVLGPCDDGGFWLFGGNRPIATHVWTGVTYSQHDTARQLCHAINESMSDKYIAWRELDMLTDLDRYDDLLPVANALHALPNPLPKQGQLARLLDEMLNESAQEATL